MRPDTVGTITGMIASIRERCLVQRKLDARLDCFWHEISAMPGYRSLGERAYVEMQLMTAAKDLSLIDTDALLDYLTTTRTEPSLGGHPRMSNGRTRTQTRGVVPIIVG